MLDLNAFQETLRHISGYAANRVLKKNATSGRIEWAALVAADIPQLSLDDLTSAAWTAYSPTITASAGTFTAVSGSGHYKQVGKVLFLTVTVTITTNNTAAGTIVVPLPNSLSAAFAASLAGRETATTGNTCTGTVFATGTTISVQRYDNAYPGADGYIITVSGVIEVA